MFQIKESCLYKLIYLLWSHIFMFLLLLFESLTKTNLFLSFPFSNSRNKNKVVLNIRYNRNIVFERDNVHIKYLDIPWTLHLLIEKVWSELDWYSNSLRNFDPWHVKDVTRVSSLSNKDLYDSKDPSLFPPD